MIGWRGYGPEHGVWVPKTEAFAFAMRHIEDLPEKDRAESARMFANGASAAEWAEWYFSGCFVRMDDAQEEGDTI